MDSKSLIVMLVFLASVCAPLGRQAAALDRDPDLESLGEIGRELSADSFNYKKKMRGKGNRGAMIRDRGNVSTRPSRQQSDLLRELLVAEDIQDVVELEAVVQYQHYK